jgi:diaminopimelate decarboxylase
MNRINDFIQGWKREHSDQPYSAYLYDLEELERTVKSRVASLPPGAEYYYAVKANSDSRIIQTLLPIVSGFEVASLGEVKKVREISHEAPILFGGPGKTDGEIEGALRVGVSLLHVESTSELLRTNEIAGQLGVIADVLLRVNLRGPLPEGTLQMCGVPSQFGIDETDIAKAIVLAMNCPNIELLGFHFHSLSNHLDAAAHAAIIAYYWERARQWQSQFGFSLRYVNTGGGIGINYENVDSPFAWDSFVSKLEQLLLRRDSQAATERPQLLFECGRFTVASCGYYAAEVLDIKRIGHACFAIVNGGLHHFLLPGAWKHRHPHFVVAVEEWRYPWNRSEVRDQSVTIVGRMNSARDVLASDERMSRLRIGDVIVFPYAGAYGWSISAHEYSSLEHPMFQYLS